MLIMLLGLVAIVIFDGLFPEWRPTQFVDTPTGPC